MVYVECAIETEVIQAMTESPDFDTSTTVHAIIVLDFWQGDKVLLSHWAKLGEATISTIWLRCINSDVAIVLIVTGSWWFT